MDYSGKIITKNPVEPSQTSAPGVWTLDQATQAVQGNNWPIAYVPNPISRSLRFNSADSAYLNRTPSSSPTGTTKGTWSFWIKRTKLATEEYIFGSRDGGNSANTMLRFESGDTLRFYQHNGSSVTWNIITTQVFRDVGAWMHILVALDTTQATDSNRIKIYVNGTQITAFGTASYPSQNANMTRWAASGVPNYIGNEGTTPGNYGDYYLTETYYIDGSALDSTYFGMTDPRTGAWIPKKYSGTYGTNGFYLNFSDNASTAALGTDYSGNSNTWTTNNFSVTAGSGNDSMVDVPTPWIPYNTTGDVGGVVRGNYATWNALDRNSSGSLTNGNLDWTSGTTAHYGVRGTISPPSGKWYFEVTASAATSGSIAYGIGMANATNPLNQGAQGNTGAYLLYGVGTSLELEAAGVQGSTITGASIAANDVIQVAYDVDGSKMWVGKNNTWYNSSGGTTGNPATGANPSFSSLLANLFPFVEVYNSTVYANFGQRPFAYTPPAGFKSLCTTNLPEPTILDGGDYFNTVLYTGNNQTLQSITTVGFQPDLIWIKNRNLSNHVLVDSVRGRGFHLASNLTNAEATDSSTQGVTAFLSNGFSVEADPASYGSVNDGTNPYVAWNWKAGGTPAVTNTAGTITSTVSANQTAGFSVVTFTMGSSGTNFSMGHGLGAKPAMIIYKNRGGNNWQVAHQSLGNMQDYYITLNSTGGSSSSSAIWYIEPTPTLFGISTGIYANSSNVVAYCFALIAGFSAFGSYTGNGSADGPFVYTGFRPRYIMLKCSSTSGLRWNIFDTSRSPYNVGAQTLYADSSAAEDSGTGADYDILSNGFKLRSTNSNPNTSGATYIYAAFAENPFKYSNAR